MSVTVSEGEDGKQNVTIDARLHFHEKGRTLAADDPRVERWISGIKEHWEGAKGDYNVTVNIDIAISPRGAISNQVVSGSRSQHGFWTSGSDGWTAAHEFGHALGLLDLQKGVSYDLGQQLYYLNRKTSIMWYYRYDGVRSNPRNSASEWDVMWAIERN